MPRTSDRPSRCRVLSPASRPRRRVCGPATAAAERIEARVLLAAAAAATRQVVVDTREELVAALQTRRRGTRSSSRPAPTPAATA